MGVYLGSYEVARDHLHGPPLWWEYNCILPVSPSYQELRFIRTSAVTDLGYTPLGFPVIGRVLHITKEKISKEFFNLKIVIAADCPVLGGRFHSFAAKSLIDAITKFLSYLF